MKQGVSVALDRLIDPGLKYAVVFDTDNWHPVRPPIGSEWDYDPFYHRHLAEERLRDMRPCETEPELWEKCADGWQQAVVF